MPTPSWFCPPKRRSPPAFAGRLLAIGMVSGVLGTPWIAPADPPDMGDLEKDKAPLAQLRLLNGDRLHGRLDGVATRKEGLAWRHPAVPTGPILFHLAHVDRMAFTEPRAAEPEEGEGELMVQVLLHNRDHLAGRLVEVNAEAIDLESDFGERLRIRRSAVAEIGVGRAGVRAYRGPVPGETWLAVQNLPTPESGPDGLVFRTTSAGAIRVPSLPESVRLDFDLDSRGPQHFAVMLFLEQTDRMHGNALWFRIHSGRIVQVMRTTTNRGSSQIGQADFRPAAPDDADTLRFSILADRPNGRITVMVNGQTVLEGTDAELSAFQGELIAFHNQHPQSRIRLRNIEVRPWTGPLVTDEVPVGEGEDAIRFVNGDALAGTLRGMVQGEVAFSSALGDFRIPLDRVDSLRLPGAAPDPGPAGGADRIRVTLAPYGLLTVALARMSVEEGLEAHGDAFGDLRIPLKAVRLVEFNLDREREGTDPW